MSVLNHLVTAESFESPLKVLVDDFILNSEEIVKAVEVLNRHQYFLLCFSLLLEAVYPKDPSRVTYLSDIKNDGALIRGIEAALNKAANLPLELAKAEQAG